MLVEIKCEKFRTKIITFHEGLNVVLGDSNGTNSIGKSSLLMVIDFVFGGNSFLEHNKDTFVELGEHEYDFAFQFQGQVHRFKRPTNERLVAICDESYEAIEWISLEDYTALLKELYLIEIENLTFRGFVGVFMRVWGKTSSDLKRPLHQNMQNNETVISNLLKIYGGFNKIEELGKSYSSSNSKLISLRSAFKNEILRKLNAKEYKSHKNEAIELQGFLNTIEEILNNRFQDFSEIVKTEAKATKDRLDLLKKRRDSLENKIERLEKNSNGTSFVRKNNFKSLKEFIPDINEEKISKIEQFHASISIALKEEIKEALAPLEDELHTTKEEISGLESSLSEILKNRKFPKIMLEKILSKRSRLDTVLAELNYHDQSKMLKVEVTDKRNAWYKLKVEELLKIENIVNKKILTISKDVKGEDQRAPKLEISETSYDYHVPENTGTGEAYLAVLILDLAVFLTSELPLLIHDSFLFKNIENDTVSELIKIYADIDKQCFIAIDEIDKYEEDAVRILIRKKVIQLTNDQTLFIKDWRKLKPESQN